MVLHAFMILASARGLCLARRLYTALTGIISTSAVLPTSLMLFFSNCHLGNTLIFILKGIFFFHYKRTLQGRPSQISSLAAFFGILYFWGSNGRKSVFCLGTFRSSSKNVHDRLLFLFPDILDLASNSSFIVFTDNLWTLSKQCLQKCDVPMALKSWETPSKKKGSSAHHLYMTRILNPKKSHENKQQ